MRGATVEQWMREKLDGWQAQVAAVLIDLVRRAAPEATLAIKWAQPVFDDHGPFAYIKPAKAHLTFGFWRGAELGDPKHLLETSGSRMAHMKLRGPDDVDAAAIVALVKQAVQRNRSEGDPTKR
jgi:hypothetical protein